MVTQIPCAVLNQTGKTFDACLKLEKIEEGKTNIVFDFDSVEQKVIRAVKCPLCGGEIIATSFGYGCANYKPGDENSCRFSIGKMAENFYGSTGPAAFKRWHYGNHAWV